LQFSDRQLHISDRKDYGCSKVPIWPQISPKWKIISAKNSTESAKVARKLHSMAKIVQLRKSCAPQHRNFLVRLLVGSLWTK